MTTRLFYLLLLLSLAVTACYKDKGNYEYDFPEEPVVTGLRDTVYVAFIGDTLTIKPTVKHPLAGTGQLTYQWKIMFTYQPYETYYDGPELKTVFSLKPGQYSGLFIITNKATGMKYFYDFRVEGRTEFTAGTVVLSNENGASQLSFIRPDNTLLPRLYEGINGESLPNKPLQLLAINRAWQPDDIRSYWVVCGEGEKPGVIIDASTMIRSSYFNDNFFTSPASIQVSALATGISGSTNGVINGKLYLGTTNTDPASPLYGKYGLASAGDYKLSPHYIYTQFQYILGFDELKKRFVRFDASGKYFGTDYHVIPIGEGFDPANVGIDLVHMQYLSGSASYAFGKDAKGKMYELKFFNGGDNFFTSYMREFSGSHLVRENTRWEGSPLEVIYFSSADKIYRYNPLNEEIKPLGTDFEGKEVSMLKLSRTGDTLITGTEGRLYYLNVGTGKNGEVINRVEGIPGAPVDVVVRK